MATAAQHRKYLAFSHLGFFAFSLLLIIGGGLFLYTIWSVDEMNEGDAAFLIFGLVLVSFINFLFIFPSMIAGWALLKHKGWAKTASLLAGLAAAAFIPLGPFVCGYSCWFFFNEPGRHLMNPPGS